MEEQLIELVKDNEILYDKKFRTVEFTEIKEEIWQNISKELHTTVDAVKKRWKTLRDKYVRERHIEEKLTPLRKRMKKQWKYWDLMRFLDGIEENTVVPTEMVKAEITTRRDSESKINAFNVSKMILSIKERPILWDKDHKNYRFTNHVLKQLAWREVCENADPNFENYEEEIKENVVMDVISKWKVIKDTYYRSLKKQVENRFIRPYIYQNQLEFLGEKYYSKQLNILKIRALVKIKNQKNVNKISSYEDDVLVQEGIEYKEEYNYENDSSLRQEVVEHEEQEGIEHEENSYKKEIDHEEEIEQIDDDYDDSYAKTEFTYVEVEQAEDSTEPSEYKILEIESDNKQESNAKHTNNLYANDFTYTVKRKRVLVPDVAFFDSILPTVENLTEDEKLEFRISVLEVLRNIKHKRKC